MAQAELKQICEELSAALAACPASASTGDAQASKLYELWLRRDDWHLFDEAVPLLFGQEPESWSQQVRELQLGPLVDRLRALIIDGVNSRSAALVRDRDQKPEDWRVEPIGFYRWAGSSSLRLPEPFENLARFIMATVHKSVTLGQPVPAPASDQGTGREREQVLGAALNLAVKCPEKCCDDNGLFSGDKMAAMIRAQSIRWFDTEVPPLSDTNMAQLIDQWLE